MMLWFTTMPASAITPMPLITMPKGWPVIIRPISTPMVDITTANRITKLLIEAVELGDQDDAIRNSATPKAFIRKACAFCLLLVLALEVDGRCRGSSVGRRQPGRDLLDLVVGQHARRHVGLARSARAGRRRG